MATVLRLPAVDRRRQILDVAMNLFARQGYEGTTTRRIAAEAHVNEAILFRHFPRKEDLYWAVIDAKCSIAGGREELKRKLRESRDDRATLSAIAEEILRRNAEDSTLARLLLFSALENHRLSERFFRTFLAERYEVLAEHIRRRIREGRYRKVDPVLAARGFFGMLVHHSLIQDIFGGKRFQQFELRRVSETFAAIWLQGILADGAPRTPRRGAAGTGTAAGTGRRIR